MRKLLIIILIVPSIAMAQQDLTGPFKLGNFVIGKTTVFDFYLKTDSSILSFKNSHTEPFTVIADDDSYYKFMEDPSSDHFGYQQVFILKPSYDNSFPEYKELYLINDKTQGFFINQMQFDHYVVNNICLQFYKDTLVYISYSGGDSIENLFAEKYKHEGRLHKVKETKSACKVKFKNGKSVMDREDSYSLLNNQNDAVTQAALFNEYDEDCNQSTYINVEIYDYKRMKEWLIFSKASAKQRLVDFNAKHANAESKVSNNF